MSDLYILLILTVIALVVVLKIPYEFFVGWKRIAWVYGFYILLFIVALLLSFFSAPVASAYFSFINAYLIPSIALIVFSTLISGLYCLLKKKPAKWYFIWAAILFLYGLLLWVILNLIGGGCPPCPVDQKCFCD